MNEYTNSFHPTVANLEEIREWFKTVFDRQKLENVEIQKDILLAVTEIFVNFVKHSSLTVDDVIQIIIHVSSNQVIIHFKEFGNSFDITKIDEPDLSQLSASGYGIYIIKKLMDSFEYIPKKRNNEPNITKITKGYYLWQKKKY